MPSRCGLIISGLALGAAGVRQRIGADSASALHAVEAVGELLQEANLGTEDLRQQLAEIARSAVTPGVEGSLQTSLQAVIKKIEGELEPKIKAAHSATQERVDQVFGAVDAANAAATAAQQIAASKDKVWFECVADEKTKREDVEAKAGSLATATSTQEAACQLQQDNRGFEYDAAPKNYTLNFGCDHIKGNCNTAITNWRSTVLDKMFTDAEAALTADETKHAALKKDCDTKKALQVKAQSALDGATSVWAEQREACAAAKTKRAEAACEFGTKSQAKCAEEQAFSDFVASTQKAKGDANSEVDRQSEWTAMFTTKCMLKRVIAKGLDSAVGKADLEACAATVKYADDVGTLDTKPAFAAVKKTNMCAARDVSFFNGQEWNVPAGSAPKAAEYTQSGYTPNFNPATGNFGFCGAAPAPAPVEAPVDEAPVEA